MNNEVFKPVADEPKEEKGFFGKVLDAGKNALKKGKDVLNAGVEDLGEIKKLKGDFKTLSETKDYFKEKQEVIEDVDPLEVLEDPLQAQALTKEINQRVIGANQAVMRILQTNLRFSEPYLGPDVQALEEALEDLNDWTIAMLEMIADQGWMGDMLRAVLPEDKVGDLGQLNVEVQLLKKNVEMFKMNLEAMIDPQLITDSNNSFLNRAIQVEKAKDYASEKIDSIKRILSIMEKMN